MDKYINAESLINKIIEIDGGACKEGNIFDIATFEVLELINEIPEVDVMYKKKGANMNMENLPKAKTENLTKHSELKDTIELMTSNDYKERFLAEYYQLLIRYGHLGELIGLYYEYKLLNKEAPMLDSPIELLNMQYEAMEKLLDILVIRAKMENIEL